MAEFRLPRDSRVKFGESHRAQAGITNSKRCVVYRYDPDSVQNRRLAICEVDLYRCAPMVLDALLKIKDGMDATLTFRRSCRGSIRGSCSMNIDGVNTISVYHV